jgi:hypothetical protein
MTKNAKSVTGNRIQTRKPHARTAPTRKAKIAAGIMFVSSLQLSISLLRIRE